MELDDDSQLADDSSVDDLVPWNHVKDQTCSGFRDVKTLMIFDVFEELEALTVDLKERCKDASPRDIYAELGVDIGYPSWNYLFSCFLGGSEHVERKRWDFTDLHCCFLLLVGTQRG